MQKQQAEAGTSGSVLKEDLGLIKKPQHVFSSSFTVRQDDISSMTKHLDEVSTSVPSKIIILEQNMNRVVQLSG